MIWKIEALQSLGEHSKRAQMNIHGAVKCYNSSCMKNFPCGGVISSENLFIKIFMFKMNCETVTVMQWNMNEFLLENFHKSKENFHKSR